MQFAFVMSYCVQFGFYFRCGRAQLADEQIGYQELDKCNPVRQSVDRKSPYWGQIKIIETQCRADADYNFNRYVAKVT